MQSMEGLLQTRATARTVPSHRVDHSSRPIDAVGRFSQGQYRILLAAMVGRGHGIEALCLFLKLTRDALFDLIVQLDLPTPHDRPLRRSGGLRAWKTNDFEVLLEGWLDDWSAACIADRLGRSRGSIYYQTRRLGLPKRDRRLLHWPEQVVIGPVSTPAPARKRLPPCWLVKGTDKVFELTSKRGGLEVNWAANIEAYIDIAWRAFSGQHPERIAADYGVSYGTITSQIWWLHANIRRNPKDLVDHFDRARGQAIAKAMGFQIRQCTINKVFPYFFTSIERVARRDKRNSKRGGMDL